MLQDLGLPDLSEIVGLPGEESLPSLIQSDGGIVFRGPSEKRINVGMRIPGTDILLTHIGEDGAEFEIAGLRSVRTIGDSLDFDGPWPGTQGVTYNLRLRIYRVADDFVRAAGVHQLEILNIEPVQRSVELREPILKFAFASGVDANNDIAGITYGYAGEDERGGQLSGLDEGRIPIPKGRGQHSLDGPDSARHYGGIQHTDAVLWRGECPGRRGSKAIFTNTTRGRSMTSGDIESSSADQATEQGKIERT